MYKMIVFDCDGTLIDASIMIELLFKGYAKMFPEREHLPYEYFIPCYFKTDKETREYLDISDSEKSEFERICYYENHNTFKETKPFEGIEDVILEIKTKGILLGIATSRSLETWKEVKDQLSLEVYEAFSYIATQDLVSNVKPAPDSLIYLMEMSNISNEYVLFVGDSISDALCAKNANVDFAWATWGLVSDEELPHKYKLNKPEDLLKIIDM